MESLFQFRDAYEIGRNYHRGWIVLRPADEGVRLAVLERGVGHDESSTGTSYDLTFAEAAELRDVLNEIVPANTEPTETPQWGPEFCDVCGGLIRSSNERWAGPYRVRRFGRFGRMVKKYGQWHRQCVPAGFMSGLSGIHW